METSAIDLDLELDPHLKRFLVANGGVENAFNVDSDIEMIAIQEASKYTSLKDLIIPTMKTCNSLDRWREIRIKDPLVKQAALSYLLPMSSSSPREVSSRSFVVKIKDECFGCFGGVVTDAVVRCLSSEEEEGKRSAFFKLRFDR